MMCHPSTSQLAEPPASPRPELWVVWSLVAACLWSCSPVPGPSAGAEAGTPAATSTAETAPGPAPAPAEPSAVATTTAAATAAPPSALPAEGPVPDPACASCLSAPVRWGWVGGNAGQRDRSVAEPCRVYRRTRTFSLRAGGQPPVSCSTRMSCDSAGTGAGQLQKLVSHPDVQKALTSPMTVYGCDMRAVDGALYGVEIDGGRSFGVGGECQGCSPPAGKCVSPPAAVKDLVVFLKSLDEKMLADDPCKSALGPG